LFTHMILSDSQADTVFGSFYSGPLRGIFSNLRRADILRDVQVLSLDGLSVTAELIHDILVDPSFSIRILSIRGAKNLNELKLRGALQYACRESRPEGTPRLKGLYVFGPQDTYISGSTPESGGSSPSRAGTSPTGVSASWNDRSQKALAASSADEQEGWYVRRGEQFPGRNRIAAQWATTLVACQGVIAFDAVLCTGPRHLNSSAWGSISIDALNAAGSPASVNIPHYAVATHSLDGCASCGTAPEGWTVWGETPTPERDEYDRRTSKSLSDEIGRFPLLAPPPMHSANVNVAMCPSGQSVRSRIPSLLSASKQPKARFIPRCFDCLRERYCAACHRWWCESCYLGPWASRPSGYGGPVIAGTEPVSQTPPTAGHAPSAASQTPLTASHSTLSKNTGHWKTMSGVCTQGDCWIKRFNDSRTASS